jgi:hypothetical protein
MQILDEINKDEALFEGIDMVHLQCESGACPI